ncbi:MAG: hypothetical protein V4508_12365 [Pseudomonadota bacterium]
MLLPAAMDEVSSLELALLLDGVHQLHGVDFRGYDAWRVRRKVDAFVQHCGLHTISGLQERVLHDAALAKALIRAIAHVPRGLLDDPAHLQALRETVLPRLRTYPWRRIWLADCTDPGSIMSLVILLEEARLYERSEVFVTAPDADLLAEVSKLTLPLAQMGRWWGRLWRVAQPGSVQRYLQADGAGFALHPALRRNLVWNQHDLGVDASFNEFQLVLCQRPLNEYARPLQRRALQLFTDSLCPFGALQVDAVPEHEQGHFMLDFRALSRAHGIYRRVA